VAADREKDLAIAATAGINVRTLYRWKRDADFVSEVRRVREAYARQSENARRKSMEAEFEAERKIREAELEAFRKSMEARLEALFSQPVGRMSAKRLFRSLVDEG
jgi:hypothetical protein